LFNEIPAFASKMLDLPAYDGLHGKLHHTKSLVDGK